MGIFIVYHKIEPDFLKEPDVVSPHDYDYVATVNAESLEHVFKVTNNIDDPWVFNTEIDKTAEKDHFRSTSVGDIVIHLPDNFLAANITVNLVCSSGFKEVQVNYDGRST